jgi:hypothetical protein
MSVSGHLPIGCKVKRESGAFCIDFFRSPAWGVSSDPQPTRISPTAVGLRRRLLNCSLTSLCFRLVPAPPRTPSSQDRAGATLKGSQDGLGSETESHDRTRPKLRVSKQAPVRRVVRSAMASLLPSILKHIAVQAHDLTQRGIHVPHFDILRMRARHGWNAGLA